MLLPTAAGHAAPADPALVALMIAVAALRREESRGAHYRSDFSTRNAFSRPSRLTLDDALETAVGLADAATPLTRSA